MEVIGVRVLKSGFAIIFSTCLALFIDLEHTATVGIFSILSILDTKRKTLQVGEQSIHLRLGGYRNIDDLFYLLEFEVYVAGMIVVVFFPIARKFDLESGFIVTNLGVEAMKNLEAMKKYYCSLPLPKTRNAFEDWAHLLLFLYHLEYFFQMKIDFHRRYIS